MKYQVIVIGGGMAGLTACVELKELGVDNFVLVEASDRLGGRINTINFGKSTVFFLFDYLIK